MKKILLLIGVLFLLTGCFSNPEEEPTPESLKDNVEIKSQKCLDKELLFIENNNSKNVSLKIHIKYYNESDENIYNIDMNTLSISGDNESVFLVNNAPKEYKESKIDYEVSVPAYRKDYSGDLDVTEKKGSTLGALVKNTGDNKIENISLGIVYYRNKQIVGYDDEILLNLESGKKETVYFINPMDKNHNYIPYDDYKIYINFAYSFDYNN